MQIKYVLKRKFPAIKKTEPILESFNLSKFSVLTFKVINGKINLHQIISIETFIQYGGTNQVRTGT